MVIDREGWANLRQVWSADLTRILVRNPARHVVGLIVFPFVDELAGGARFRMMSLGRTGAFTTGNGVGTKTRPQLEFPKGFRTSP